MCPVHTAVSPIKPFISCTDVRWYLKVSDDRWVVVDGFAVHGFPHALAVEGELLHGLLLRKVRPLVEELPRGLMLEAGHVEEPWRGADLRRHDRARSAEPGNESRRSATAYILQHRTGSGPENGCEHSSLNVHE